MQLNKAVALLGVIISVLFYKCTSRPHPQTIVTLNTIITDSVPFKVIFRWAIFDTTKSLQVKGIDSLAAYKLYFDNPGEAILLGAPNPIKDYVLYVSGISKRNQKRVVLLDTNNDGSVADEKTYFIDENPPYIPITNIQYREGGVVNKATFYVKPYINRELVAGDRKKRRRYVIDNIGALIRPTYHYGTLKTEDGDYKFALCNYYQNDYTAQTAYLSVVPASGAFPPPHASPVYYRPEDVIYLGKKSYKFKSMSKDGSQISLEELDANLKKIGADSGLYAIPIQGIDIRSGKKYDLGNAKTYTILDFWGTWCGPCLKLVPDLQALNDLHSKYNFQLVSIAYDDNPKTVSDHIQQQGIYWTNLFDDRNNSVITENYNVSIFPTFVLIDKEGKIIYRGAGQEALRKIESILQHNQ